MKKLLLTAFASVCITTSALSAPSVLEPANLATLTSGSLAAFISYKALCNARRNPLLAAVAVTACALPYKVAQWLDTKNKLATTEMYLQLHRNHLTTTIANCALSVYSCNVESAFKQIPAMLPAVPILSTAYKALSSEIAVILARRVANIF